VALDSQGRGVELHDRQMRLLTEAWRSQPRNILELLLETHKLRAFYRLLDVLVCANFRGPRKFSKARMRFIWEVFGFHFRIIDISCKDLTFTFDVDELEVDMQFITGAIRNIVGCNQYNVSSETIKGKVVMDIGANLGVFSLLVARMGAEKVIAFEPVNATYEILKRNIELNGLQGIIFPVNKALGDKAGRGQISYVVAGDDRATLDPTFESYSRVGSLTQECEITTADELLSEQQTGTSFVKIDSEGSEKKIIIGAREVIRTSKPLLSICAYHHEDDVEEILRLVLSIRDDYRCELLERPERVLYFF
jgi:FkbM family methyltransferase